MNAELAINKLRKFFVKHKRLPTYEEMCGIFNFSSKSSCHYLINKLVEMQVLERDKKGHLSVKHLFSIPLLGSIRAGSPTPAEALSDQSLNLYDYLVSQSGPLFSLIVRGDSMIEEGIADGDIVIVEKTRKPNDHDVVAAFVDGDWTIKYFSKQNGRVVLLPANKKYKPIYPTYDMQIGGVVISVIRKYH
jgi:SOS regulatory protein LexA